MINRTCNNDQCRVVVYASYSRKSNNDVAADMDNRCPGCTWVGTVVMTPRRVGTVHEAEAKEPTPQEVQTNDIGDKPSHYHEGAITEASSISPYCGVNHPTFSGVSCQRPVGHTLMTHNEPHMHKYINGENRYEWRRD